MTTPNEQGIEARLAAVEDRLAIYTLIASHPPSADTAAADYTREVYVEDGVFDRGPSLSGARGVQEIASFTLKPEHQEAIRGGLAHFASLPLIDLQGDQAFHILHPNPATRPRGHTARVGKPRNIARLPGPSRRDQPVASREGRWAMDDQVEDDPVDRWDRRAFGALVARAVIGLGGSLPGATGQLSRGKRHSIRAAVPGLPGNGSSSDHGERRPSVAGALQAFR